MLLSSHSLIAKLASTPDEQAMLDIACELAESAGFDYVRLALVVPCAIQRPRVVILNSCPVTWVETYPNSRYTAVYPIVTHCM